MSKTLLLPTLFAPAAKLSMLIARDGSAIASSQADPHRVDTFQRGPNPEDAAPDSQPKMLRLVTTPDPTESKQIEMLLPDTESVVHPGLDVLAEPLERFNRVYNAGRQARGEDDYVSAYGYFDQALSVLEAPFSDGRDARSFYEYLPNGHRIFQDVVFQVGLLSGAKRSPGVIRRLKATEARIEKKGSPEFNLTYQWARLIGAYSLMKHAASTEQPREDLYKQALKIAREAGPRVAMHIPADKDAEINGGRDEAERARIKKRIEDAENAHFFAGLLPVEILARQYDLAHGRGLKREQIELIHKIEKAFDLLKQNHHDDAIRMEQIEQYQADIAILLAELGVLNKALEMARSITKDPTSQAATRLLDDEAFALFKDRTKETRILSNAEIRNRLYDKNNPSPKRKQFKAAIVNSHSGGLKRNFIWSGAGSAVGAGGWLTAKALAGDFSIDSTELMIAGGVGAFAGTSLNRLLNGLRSDEARFAGRTGYFGKSGRTVGLEAVKMLGSNLISAAPWAVPWALLGTYDAAFEIGAGFFSNGGELWSELFDPATYAHLANATDQRNSAQLLAYHLLTKGALLLYAAQLISPALRKRTGNLSLLFSPFTLMAGIELNTFITDPSSISLIPPFAHENFWNAAGILGIVTGEMVIQTMVSGMIAFKKGRPGKEIAADFWKNWSPRKKDSKWPFLNATVITTGILAAFGGRLGHDIIPANLYEGAILGGLISMACLLPAYALCGACTRMMPTFDRFGEDRNDALNITYKDEKASKKHLYAIGQATWGVVSSVNSPFGRQRFFRAPTLDLPPAALRAMLGWNTPGGQFIYSLLNLLVFNNVATIGQKDIGGSVFEREAIQDNVVSKAMQDYFDRIDADLKDKKITKADANEKKKARKEDRLLAQALEEADVKSLLHYFEIAGQLAHPAHPQMDFDNPLRSIEPLLAVTRPVKPFKFPQVVNADFYANLFQMLMGKSEQKITPAQVDILLNFLKEIAPDPTAGHIAVPLTKTLLLARGSAAFGKTIGDFFKSNPEIAFMQDINPVDYYMPPGQTRRLDRKQVIEKIGGKYFNGKNFHEYEQAVQSFGRQKEHEDHFTGLFMRHVPIVVAKPKATPAATAEPPAQPQEQTLPKKPSGAN